MIIDVTGVELTPSSEGKDCLGNGTHYNDNGAVFSMRTAPLSLIL